MQKIGRIKSRSVFSDVLLRINKGFTLIELMVVLGIIILLAAILFPVIVSARNRALASIDISNLHQIGMAIRMYQEDHEGFPPYPNWLLPYTSSQRIFICPYDPTKGARGLGFVPEGASAVRNSYSWITLTLLVIKENPPDPIGWPHELATKAYEQHPSDYPFVVDLIQSLYPSQSQTFLRGIYSPAEPIYVLHSDGRVSTWLINQGPLGALDIINRATGE